ncbi:MAG: hypothetical protein PVF63_06185 [Gammaproteobacteria bacterium]|jgi:hypothetical protein
MRVAKLSTVLASTLIIPSLASAEFSYTTIDAGFIDVDFNPGLIDLDGDGYRIGGSYSLNNQFFVHGAWEDQSFDLGIDGHVLELGGGYHYSFTSDLDFVATASLVQAEVSAGGLGVDDDGIQIGGGIRARLADAFQIEAMLDWVDFDNGGSDTGVSLKGRYYFNDQLAIGLETDLDDDFDALTLGVRVEF